MRGLDALDPHPQRGEFRRVPPASQPLRMVRKYIRDGSLFRGNAAGLVPAVHPHGISEG